jgi:hypothetical protein
MEMRMQRITAIIVLAVVVGIAGIIIATSYSKQNSIAATDIAQSISTWTPEVFEQNVWQFGSPESMNQIPNSTEVVNLNSSNITALNLFLVEITENVAMQIYNTTGATSFVPGWNENFTLLVRWESGTNYTYPFNRQQEVSEQFCNYNGSAGATGCSMITTISESQQRFQVTNFTLPDGARGFAYQNFATWWDYGKQYSINSAGMSISQVIDVIDSMEPTSAITN